MRVKAFKDIFISFSAQVWAMGRKGRKGKEGREGREEKEGKEGKE